MVITVKDLIGIVGIVLSFGLIITNIISNRKLSIISMILFLVVGGSLALRVFRNDLFIQYLNFIPTPEMTLIIASGGLLLISFIEYLVWTIKAFHRQRLLNQGVFYDDSRILAYVTKNNRLFHNSKQMDEIVRGLKQSENQFKIQKVFNDSIEIEPKKILKSIAKCNGIIDEPVKFKIRYNNGFENDLSIIKKPITKSVKSEKVIGYALIDDSVQAMQITELEKNYKRDLFIHLDLIGQPVAYFDQEGNGYVLTNNLSKLLGIEDRIITADNLKKLIHPEDITEYEDIKNHDNKIFQRYFRLKSVNSYFWFKESLVSYFGKDYVLLKKSDASFTIDLEFKGYKQMVKDLEILTNEDTEFAVSIINMNTIPELIDSMGNDYANIVINKFFTTVLNSELKDQVEIYKIGNIEYGLLIKGKEYIDLVTRSLYNQSSILLTQNIYVSRKRNLITTQLAFVSSTEFETLDPRVIIKAAFDTIKIVTDESFEGNYSIYQEIEVVEKEYDLSSLGINLDEDLDEFTDLLDDM